MFLFTREHEFVSTCMYLRACLHRAARAARREGASSVLYVCIIQSAFYTNSRDARYCPSDDERSAELLPAGATSTARDINFALRRRT